MLTIASALPGRIRLRAAGRNDPLPALATACQTLDTISAVRINAAARSLVLTYDAAACDLPTMLARLAAIIPLDAGTAAVPVAILRHKRRRPMKLRINRIAKLGALASLTASLAWAAGGNKRLHTISGLVFLGFLTVHLAVYRRNLTR